MKKQSVFLIQLFVTTRVTSEHGIQITTIREVECTKGSGCYVGHGLILPINKCGIPEEANTSRGTGYYIWTTKDQAKESALKCVESIVTEFEKKDKLLEEVRESVKMAKIMLYDHKINNK